LLQAHFSFHVLHIFVPKVPSYIYRDDVCLHFVSSGEAQCVYECCNMGTLYSCFITRFFDVAADFSVVTPLSRLVSCKFSFLVC